MKTAFLDELLILLAHGAGKFHHCQAGDIASSLEAKHAIPNREEERECCEVVALREVSTHRTGHLPEFAFAMRERFLIREEIREPFHRDPEPLSENIVPCLLYTSDAADDLLCVDPGGR